MKITPTFQNVIVSTISFLYILLFVYAATSKLMEFENFQAQLGQSPLINVFAGFISYTVLVAEFTISFGLALPKFRELSLYAAFAIMVIFTTYIAVILNYSTNIPCSCGGILEKMGWKEHLIFNVVFTILAIPAILVYPAGTKIKNFSKL